MDEGTFSLTFPCFTLLGRRGSGGIVQPLPGGEAAAVLLTSEDLLDRYRREHALTANRVLRFDTAADLGHFLDLLPPAITQVAVDPTGDVARCLRRDYLRGLVRRYREPGAP